MKTAGLVATTLAGAVALNVIFWAPLFRHRALAQSAAAHTPLPVDATPLGPIMRIHDRPMGVVCYAIPGHFEVATGRNQSGALFCLRDGDKP